MNATDALTQHLGEEYKASNQRIAKNTIILYARMFLMMLVGLYTSRVVLNALGAVDYGIYTVVGSVVSIFSIISGSLTTAVSRFLTFDLGSGDKERLNRIFCTSIIIQIILSLIIIVVIESVGWWFIYNKMQIPSNRVDAAIWVMHLSVITFAIGLISVPYNALIIAHERMSAFAYISLLEVLLKLGIAFLLVWTLKDKLIVYATLMTIVAILLRIIYGIYCNRHFEEAKFHFIFDRKLLKEMFGFAGWNFIGASSVVLRDQGGNIILNIFGGPVVNAARGVATQVFGIVSQFVSNFQTAFNPQITKSFASGDRTYMLSLIFRASRFSFYLLLLLCLPVFLETQYILDLWLKNVPAHSADFAKLMLLFVLSESLANPIVTGMLASGNIRNFQIVAGGIQLLNFPMAYIAMRLGSPPEAVFLIAFVLSQITLFVKLIMVKPLIGINIKAFIKQVYLNVVSVMIISSIIPIIVNRMMNEGIVRLITSTFVSIATVLIVIYFIGFTNSERKQVKTWVCSIKSRFKKGGNFFKNTRKTA